MSSVKQLEQRKADIKVRIAALNAELTPALAKVENLRERIAGLTDDLKDVLDALREAQR